MLDESSYDPRGSFRTEREFSAAPIFKDVHLFLHDVGGISQRALEKFRRLESRRSDFLKAETREFLARPALRALEEGGVRRKNVFDAANGLEFRHGQKLYI